ncbi:UDP-N-acetylmuramoyl-tripeptide--D-alanyl-D-alanine ligase [Aerococcaceae bacterium DSM 111020]|nr:UDP-N-acetylmuramoyl-tripeptide--D-alanyl-D-alanine ligase [Aerococcaceae bacterium DSM 111020]
MKPNKIYGKNKTGELYLRPITIAEIKSAINNAKYEGNQEDLKINRVEFDSRKAESGTLFVPLTGGNTDGHSYIQTAIDQGATACLWQKNHEQEAPTNQIEVIYVEDTLVAFQQLAHYYRRLIDPIVVGVTGSNGKTTTKDMLEAVLTAKYHVHKTQGNYNNEIGVPYTILQMPEDTEVLVCEMGMSGFGEIAELTRIAEPNVAVITLIGESHLEHLGSRQGIAQAKLEILDGLRDEGVLIYPFNEPLIHNYLEKNADTVETITIGFESEADVYAFDMIEEQTQTYFKTNLDPSVRCIIPVMGSYNVSNALIALGVAQYLNVPIEQAIFQLAQFKLTANRLEWLETKQGAQLLNDAYNASPTSMHSVIHTFSNLKVQPSQRKILLLGDIRELGEQSAEMHRQLSESINVNKIDKVYLFGEEMKYLYDILQEKMADSDLFYEKDNHDKVTQQLASTLTKQDLILVKSSFGTDLLQIVQHLTQGNSQ